MIATQTRRWHPFDTDADFYRAAADFILAAAKRAISERDAFLIVLAGGNTPRPVYRLLRHAATDWPAWHVYFGDERCAPPDDPVRNSRMAQEEWLAHVPIPRHQIHPIPAELGAEAAAQAYAQELAHTGPFDLVLLGLGEDGHTASLFPGGNWERARALPQVIAVHHAPKPPALRISLSPQRLSEAREVAYLAHGENKRDALAKWRMGDALPAAAIRPNAGVDIFLRV